MTNTEPADAPPTILSAELGAGTIRIETNTSRCELQALFGFAERINPRRAFLFVSRVLGRHIPARPSTMRAALVRLAAGLDADAPGPVLFTGMAETAVGLGAGVHDAWVALTGRHDTLFLSTTRTRFPGPLYAEFREEHSHASRHLLHLPRATGDRDLLSQARTLVMVDDEASTGKTFHNLAQALRAAGLNRLQRVVSCVLTDWSGGADGMEVPTGPPTEHFSLLRGRYTWTPRPGAEPRPLPDPDIDRRGTFPPIDRTGDGRLGRSRRSPRALPSGLSESLSGEDGPVLVVGTGEHVWEPFLYAEELETEGFDVRFGATTRSPILLGGAIRTAMIFADHEGLGIANYLYNVDPADWARIVLCVDTDLNAIDPGLLARLRPDLVLGDRFIRFEALAPRAAAATPSLLHSLEPSFDCSPAETAA